MSKLDDFETWLRATGSPEDVAMFSSSVVSGILAVAGKQPVAAEHVAASAQLARDAGVADVGAIERLGALLVQFEGAEPVAPVEPPAPVAISIRMPTVAPPEPAPVTISIRMPIVADAPVRRRSPIAPIAVAVLAVGGVSAWWITRGEPEPEAASAHVAPRPAARIERLASLDLPAAFPEGWQIVHGTSRTARVVHGGAADPDDAVFVSTLPLVAALADGAKLAAPALIAVAHDAEQGAAAQLLSIDARYYSEGCETASARTAVCRGTAMSAGEIVTLATYVRVGAKRAVLALFMAKPDAVEPVTTANAIVDSLDL